MISGKLIGAAKSKIKNCYDIVLKNKYYMKPTLKSDHIVTIGGAKRHAPYVVSIDDFPESPIVYSFGLGDEVELETRLIDEYNCEVWGYDPMPKSAEYINEFIKSNKFHFMQAALMGRDGVERCYFPQNKNYISGSLRKENVNWQKFSEDSFMVNTFCLKTLMNMNNHNRIDFLKLCVEGAEFEVVKNIIETEVDVQQIAISFCGRGIKKLYNQEKKLYNDLLSIGYDLLPYSYDGHLTFLKK